MVDFGISVYQSAWCAVDFGACTGVLSGDG
jgi:hypothetical protein